MAGAGARAATRLQPMPRARAPHAPAPALAARFRLVIDLGQGIGSREWLRGAATCLALCFSATAFWPDLSAIDAPAPAPLTDTQWEQARALAIQPASRGSATGRRMAPTDAVQPLLNAPERPLMELRASLAAPGDLAGALIRSGVSQAEAGEAAAMVAQVVPLAQLPAGTILDLRLGRRDKPSDPRPLEKLVFRASFGLRIDILRADGRLALNRVPIAIDFTPLRIQGHVGASLYRSARAAGVPPHVVAAYIRVLSTQIGMPAGLSANDRFDIVVENRRAETGETETGALLYVGLDRANGRDIQMMPWSIGGAAQWFEASGAGRETSAGFRMPVAGRITSGFGTRTHPILRYQRMHAGLDFGAPYGAPIVAASAGQVVGAGWDGGYGKTVRISHGSGLVTLYGHMSDLAVSPGQQVAAGQVIGYVGSTGLSTGPHLHYELHVNGQRVDPASYRHVTRSLLAGADLEAFRARMRSLLSLPVGAAPVQSASNGPARPVSSPVSRPVQTPLSAPPRPAPPRAAGF
jgi:murein DD-endopeptidase MepM/ murein hydrolase activator NlpD